MSDTDSLSVTASAGEPARESVHLPGHDPVCQFPERSVRLAPNLNDNSESLVSCSARRSLRGHGRPARARAGPAAAAASCGLPGRPDAAPRPLNSLDASWNGKRILAESRF